MYLGNAIAAIALAAVFCTANFGAQAFEDSKYPDLQGQWIRAQAPGTADEPRFDPGKPPGRGQEPPLTAEYQAIFEANLREREAGVPGTWPGPSCLPPGMPAQMTAYRPLEFIVFPNMTYIRIVMLNEMTTVDKALTRPWAVIKKYGRNPKEEPEWAEDNCTEGNGHVVIQGQGYFLAGDGNLMPTSKDQPTPDLRFFKQPAK